MGLMAVSWLVVARDPAYTKLLDRWDSLRSDSHFEDPSLHKFDGSQDRLHSRLESRVWTWLGVERTAPFVAKSSLFPGWERARRADERSG